MPKMKTKKAISKRVKITGRGKIMLHKAGAGHLKSRKTPSQLRRMRKTRELPKQYRRAITRLLGGKV